MAFDITHWPRFLEIKHVGETRYGDRLAGLQAMAEFSARHVERKPVLINFLDADLVIDKGSEPDYMLQAITHPFFDGRSVALIGISQAQAQAAITAAAIRGVEIGVFVSRAEAVDWLRASPRSSSVEQG